MARCPTNKLLATSLVSVFLAALAFAQQPSAAPVLVRSDPAETTIAITEAADLQVVLDEVCKQTKSMCDGTQYLAGGKVAPLNLRGSWNSVIDQLLEGSGVNYVSSPPTEASRGRLIIQAKGANSPDSGFTQKGTQRPAAVRADVSGTNSSPDRTLVPVDLSQSGIEASQSASADSPAGEASSFSGSPLTSDMPVVANSEPAAYMPFPDSQGNPIPTANEPVLYLPFPDSHGNPIPVDPKAPPGSPFPIDAIRHANGH